MERRKLIEVALPLEAINKEAAREKSIRHGHPATLHLWWARRPLAAARAVLFAQLVDDPASRPEAEAIEDDDAREAWIAAERTRLFRLIEELVKWENSDNERVLNAARAEILRSTDGHPPAILDPFAGGGSIPLEAQRLGLEAHASDLNPVAVLINKALIEIPPAFAGRPPLFPGAAQSKLGEWPKATGLAEDVRRYGGWLRDEAEVSIGRLYPQLTLLDGSKATVIAWIWARTVECPNPACASEVPLISNMALAKKKGKEASLVAVVENGTVHFRVSNTVAGLSNKRGQGAKFVCWVCASALTPDQIHTQLDVRDKPPSRLIAVVAEGSRRRIYLEPDDIQAWAAAAVADEARALRSSEAVLKPTTRGTFGGNAQGRRYGMFEFTDYFTDRQLFALTTFSDLVIRARSRIMGDCLRSGMAEGDSLTAGGSGARAYADAVSTYLGFAISKATDYHNSLCGWRSDTKNEGIGHLFSRQAIPMVWDFCEANPFSESSGNLNSQFSWIAKVIDALVPSAPGIAVQCDAVFQDYSSGLLSTDPPYYDNIGYSDLSDFFYVWLRRSLRDIYPDLLGTMLVPKMDELVANAYRHGGKAGAERFFEAGFQEVFRQARIFANRDSPAAVYYAFKQTETTEDGESSTGWTTLLDGLVRNAWQITGTWPMRSELGNRLIASGNNALASSIVLALRPRSPEAPVTDRRGFVSRLRDELPGRLRELQQGSIAPVDLPQAAIGPGMAVFSRYSKVMETDGRAMPVRAALQIINQLLGEVLSEQEGDFDSGTRWCLKWFELNGFSVGKYGDAEQLASAYNTSVTSLAHSGVLIEGQGKVQLLAPAEMPDGYDPRQDDHITLWEVVMHLAKDLDTSGLDSAGSVLARSAARIDVDAAKELAYLLYSVAERKKWSAIAQLFNMLAASWSDVTDAARRSPDGTEEQLELDTLY